MTKRILAAVLAVGLIATCFSACGKKKVVTKDGKDYEAVTDANGNIQFDTDGDIYVYQTDEKGEYVTDENGEKKQVLVDANEQVISKKKVETPAYVLTLPKNGWSLEENGRFVQNKSKGAASFVLKEFGKRPAEETLDAIAKKEQEDNKPFLDAIREKFPVAEMRVEDATITEKQVPAKTVEFVVKDENDKMVYYAHGTYFFHKDILYKVEYICTDGQYYSDSIDMLAIINENLSLK